MENSTEHREERKRVREREGMLKEGREEGRETRKSVRATQGREERNE